MKYFTSLYNSFLISLTASLLLFTSEWLEMRVNLGMIFFIILIISFIALSIVSKNKVKIGFIFTLVNLVVCFLIGFIFYGIKRLTIVPASIIREGLHMTSIGFTTINILIIIFLVVGLMIILLKCKNKRLS